MPREGSGVEVVAGTDAASVGRRVRAVVDAGGRAAGFVGDPDDDRGALDALIADVTRDPTRDANLG